MEPFARHAYEPPEDDAPKDSGAMTEAEKLATATRIIKGKEDPAPTRAIEALHWLISTARVHLRRYEEAYDAQRQKRKPAIGEPVENPSAERRERRNKAARAAAELARSAYDDFLINGRAVGDIYFHELKALRDENLLAAHVAEALLKHVAEPTAPIKVRDMISEKALMALIKSARETVAEEIANWDN